MIVEIKKYTFLVHHSDYSVLLDSLRDLGVVHIVEKRKLDEESPIGLELKSLKSYRNVVRRLNVLVPGSSPEENDKEPGQALQEFESLLTGMEDTSQMIETLKSEAEVSEPWGNFNKETIGKLAESGWKIKLFVCPEKRFDKKWEDQYPLEVVGRKRGRLYFVIIQNDDELPDIKADEVKIPERTIGEVFAELEKNKKKLQEIKTAMKLNASNWLASLNRGIGEAINRIEYSEAAEQADRYADDNLYVLEGWVPVSGEKKLREILQTSDCYYFVSEPDPGEKIPIILRNNRFSKLFEPISRLFALPDYRELDLTPFFAPFFMLFFGFCLGDAGYGLIFIIAGFLVKRKVDPGLRPVITLAQYFGVAAVIMGLVSGTLFGINLIDTGYTITENSILQMDKAGIQENTLSMMDQVKGIEFESRQSFAGEITRVIGIDGYRKYKRIILQSAESDFPFLISFRHMMLDSLNMFYLAILIGALQILFGMILKVVNLARQKGFKHSLSTIGWVLLMITLIIFKGGARLGLVNNEKLNPLFIGLLIISGIMIFLLNNPGKNIFIRIGLGIWDSYGIVTGVFGDLLSYIRLFALGISSSILGFVFNQIAMQFLSMRYVGWLFFVILLLIGHTLNIAIAALGSFVHPMRLTFVEFYKNAGFTGGGIEYKPFKIKNENN